MTYVKLKSILKGFFGDIVYHFVAASNRAYFYDVESRQVT